MSIPVYGSFQTTSCPRLAQMPQATMGGYKAASGVAIRHEMRPVRVESNNYKVEANWKSNAGSESFKVMTVSGQTRQDYGNSVSGGYAGNTGRAGYTGYAGTTGYTGVASVSGNTMAVGRANGMVRVDRTMLEELKRKLPGGGGSDTRYVNWIEKQLWVQEGGYQNVAAYWNSDLTVFWYNEQTLKELYDKYVENNDGWDTGDAPGYFTWDEFIGWLYDYQTDAASKHRLPLGDGVWVMVLLAAAFVLVHNYSQRKRDFFSQKLSTMGQQLF